MAWGISKRVEMSSCTLDEAEVAEDLKRDSVLSLLRFSLIKLWGFGDRGKLSILNKSFGVLGIGGS
jgi:hypothetical protein